MKWHIPMLLVALLMIPATAYGMMYHEVPEEPVVEFSWYHQENVMTMYDYSVHIKAWDDRKYMHSGYAHIPGPLKGAIVTVQITPIDDSTVISEMVGKTGRFGTVALAEKITTHEYTPYNFYNATVTVQYGDSIATDSKLFYVFQRSY